MQTVNESVLYVKKLQEYSLHLFLPLTLVVWALTVKLDQTGPVVLTTMFWLSVAVLSNYFNKRVDIESHHVLLGKVFYNSKSLIGSTVICGGVAIAQYLVNWDAYLFFGSMAFGFGLSLILPSVVITLLSVMIPTFTLILIPMAVYGVGVEYIMTPLAFFITVQLVTYMRTLSIKIE